MKYAIPSLFQLAIQLTTNAGVGISNSIKKDRENAKISMKVSKNIFQKVMNMFSNMRIYIPEKE